MQFDRLKRRQFITLIVGAAAWPVAARGERPTPLVGILQQGATGSNPQNSAGFLKGLSEMGYVQGRNLGIDHRFAENLVERLDGLAADLVRRDVALIAALGSDAAAAAAKRATRTIPIVFEIGGNPVELGLVASLNRPGANLTGVTSMNAELQAKRLGLLHDLLPQARRIAALINKDSPNYETILKILHAAASRIGIDIEFFRASNPTDIDDAFAAMVQKRAQALLTAPGAPFNERRVQIVSLAARHVLPTMYTARDDALAGGLMSYSVSADRFRQVGIYAGRILKGEKPGELPVMQPTKFEFIINLQAAKTLGITVPPTLLAQADEVIE
jgi:putative ABC transport system substrate-binding protein